MPHTLRRGEGRGRRPATGIGPGRSWADGVARYAATRAPLRVFLPLAGGLSAAAAIGGGAPAGLAAWGATLGLAGTLLFQFRLWDDLADVADDRRRHPERVLAQRASLRPFWGLVLAVAALNLAFVAARAGGARRLVALALLDGGAALWYGGLRTAVRSRLIGAHVVLAKYPVFVYLLAAGADGGRPVALGLAMGLVYLGLAVYEFAHDPRLRTLPGAAGLLVLEAAAACACLALVVSLGGRP